MVIQQKLGLQTRLAQRLILTPSLQQAIKLLPLTTLELAEVLEQEMMENPLLEETPQQETAPAEETETEAAADTARPACAPPPPLDWHRRIHLFSHSSIRLQFYPPGGGPCGPGSGSE